MENNLKSIVYLTVNTKNNKIYVGVHITENPYKFDGYIGCGICGTFSYHFKHPKTVFQRACKKYGLDTFKRYTLFVYDTYEEALKMEKEIVNEEFIKREDTYNTALGGGAGLVPNTEIEIYKYDLDGTYIESYRSQSDASRKNNVCIGSIRSAIITRSICNGFYWSETKVAKLNTTLYSKAQKLPIYLYDSTGKFVTSMDSITSFIKKYEVNLSSVQRAIQFHNKCKNFYILLEKKDYITPKKYTRRSWKTAKIYQYDINGNFIREYSNSQELKEELGECSRISHSCIEGLKYLGYYWSYNKLDKFPIKTKKYIGQYDLEGKLIKKWDSYRDCNKAFSGLRAVLKGGRTQTKGFTFKYID